MIKKKITKSKKECQLVFGFNSLGMIMFHCKTHGDIKSIYNRLRTKCRNRLIKRLEKIFAN